MNWVAQLNSGEWDPGSFQGVTRGNTVTIVEKLPLKFANHFLAKNALDCGILRIQYLKVSRGNTPGPRRNAPGAWTQTPISACLASVAIVPVLRNDHCVDRICAGVSSHSPHFRCIISTKMRISLLWTLAIHQSISTI